MQNTSTSICNSIIMMTLSENTDNKGFEMMIGYKADDDFDQWQVCPMLVKRPFTVRMEKPIITTKPKQFTQ